MQRFYIRGGRRLKGRISCHGGKNAALAVMAASLAVEGKSEIRNVPHTHDIYTMLSIMQHLGAEVELSPDGVLTVDAARLSGYNAPYDLVRRMRGSFHVAGALLGRFGRANVALPGGCVIGSRPVDLHIRGFQAMGADVRIAHGEMIARAIRLHGGHVELDRKFCSVGATINILLAAVLARGETTIDFASRDPDVVQCAEFLRAAGAEIDGLGTHHLRIRGVDRLHGVRYTISGDRIEAGTFLIAAAMTGGDVTVDNFNPEHLARVLDKLDEAGMDITVGEDSVRLRARRRPLPVDLETAPYPGFPTDLQPPMVAMASIAEGKSFLHETIFEGRLTYIDELTRMGAQIRSLDGRTAIITGVKRLSGARVVATDLRAGAALVLAGLVAEGETEVEGVENIDRGYVRLEEKLRKLGANISRIDLSDRRANLSIA